MKAVLRGPTPEDLNFIYSSWLKSQRNNLEFKEMSNEDYYDTTKRIINSLINRSSISVACSPDDPKHLYGYIVFEGDTVHFLYVKFTYRKFGIARSLFAAAQGFGDKVYASFSPFERKLLSKANLKFNPYRRFVLKQTA